MTPIPVHKEARSRARLTVPAVAFAALAFANQDATPAARATDATIVADSTGGFFNTRDPAIREDQARASIARLEDTADTMPTQVLSVRFLFRRGLSGTEFASIFGPMKIETHELVLKVPENDHGQIVTMMLGSFYIRAFGDDTTRNAAKVVECQRARASAQAKMLSQRSPNSPDAQDFAANQARIAVSPDLKIYVAGFIGTASNLAAARKAGAELTWTVAFDPG